MATHTLFSPALTASLLCLGMVLPTVASAVDLYDPVPCSQTPAGCPSSMSNDAWGYPHGSGAGWDLGAPGGSVAVAGHLTESIGGREREIDQFAELFLVGTGGARLPASDLYVYTGDVFDTRYRTKKPGFSLLMINMDALAPAYRDVMPADVNNDGVRDLVVGDPGGSCGSGGTGRLLIFFDISMVHDATDPDHVVCGLPGQAIGNYVGSNRLTGVQGSAVVKTGMTWYKISGVTGSYSFVSDYPSWTAP